MNKKSYISLLFLLAFSVLFLHSIIPHHHEDEQVTHQAGHHNDGHDDEDHDALSHAFGSFQHHEGSTVIYEVAPCIVQIHKPNVESSAVLFIQHFISLIEKPPLIHFEQYLFFFVSSPYTNHQRFRGPPSFLA